MNRHKNNPLVNKLRLNLSRNKIIIELKKKYKLQNQSDHHIIDH
jgi:hypothetical protein